MNEQKSARLTIITLACTVVISASSFLALSSAIAVLSTSSDTRLWSAMKSCDETDIALVRYVLLYGKKGLESRVGPDKSPTSLDRAAC